MGKNKKETEIEQLRLLREKRNVAASKRKRQDLIFWITVAVVVAVVAITALTITLIRNGKEDEPINYFETADISEFTETDQVTEYVKLNVSFINSDGFAKNEDIIIRLFPDVAPITVENFQSLVNRHFYDQSTFHRICNDFLIQGGAPKGDLTQRDEKTIKGEFSKNGVPNSLKHVRGVVSMARTMEYNSASSQFFIVQKDSPHLDSAYAAFGFAMYGMEAVDEIAAVPVDTNDAPLNTVTLNSAVFVKRQGK